MSKKCFQCGHYETQHSMKFQKRLQFCTCDYDDCDCPCLVVAVDKSEAALYDIDEQENDCCD